MGVLFVILLIISIIALLVTFVLFIRVRYIVTYNGELSVTRKILFFKTSVYPDDLTKINIKDYSLKKIKKRRLKAEKEAEELRKTQKKISSSDGQKKKKSSFSDIVSLVSEIKDIVTAFAKIFFEYLQIDVTKIDIVVTGEDAAKTAITYGAVYQAVSYILAIIDKITTVKYDKKSYVSVRADFLAEKFYADINITFSMRLGQAIKLLMKNAYRLAEKQKTVGSVLTDENTESPKGKRENV